MTFCVEEVDLANISTKSIHAVLSALFSEVLHIEISSIDTDLFDTGILDSQRFVELLLYIERNFHIQIDIEHFELENFRIEKIATLILQHKAVIRLAEFSGASKAAG
jgi:acyl carrier protein